MLIYFAWASGILLLIVLVFSARCWRDLHLHYRRINSRGICIPSPFGDIQFLTGGRGPAVLVIHGSGGGYDQGELIAEAVLGESFRWIAPSRFGYLKSDLPQRASWDDQAHAYARLLDHLDIGKVAVVAMSHGGPSALLFCLLYPGRVSSLTLLSCGVAASADPAQAKANKKGKLLKLIYQYDWLYWLISKMFRRQFLALIGASPTVVARLASQPRNDIDRLIDYMNPVAPRSAGVAFDNATPLPGNRIAAIQTPTLIIHAQDDSLQLYHNAEFAAATIPTARLVSYVQGGHVVILVEQAEIRSLVQRHIRDHSD
jgi:2-hydroxy-6-oxonona-2,4-dienedioate hydrolase